ncbi:hypothetical protein FQR65_LT02376 [Abscondita terminalis]|nr:hypothetical protein FQR65_LT02376 [Abscondita terminalis]
MAKSILIKNSLTRKQYRDVAKSVQKSMSLISYNRNVLENTPTVCCSIDNLDKCEGKNSANILGDLMFSDDENICQPNDVPQTPAETVIFVNDYVLDASTCSSYFDATANEQNPLNYNLLTRYHDTKNENSNLAFQLGSWATNYNIPLISLGKLLGILKNVKNVNDLSELPKDPRTLLHTPNSTITRKMGCGSYFYFGIQKCIEDLFLKYKVNINNNTDTITMSVNIDGLPLHKSTGNSLWPILCVIKSIEVLADKIFVLGIFCGTTKPPANEFISDFVTESRKLCENRIQINKSVLNFRISSLICDAPAKSHIMAIKGHTGHFSC